MAVLDRPRDQRGPGDDGASRVEPEDELGRAREVQLGVHVGEVVADQSGKRVSEGPDDAGVRGSAEERQAGRHGRGQEGHEGVDGADGHVRRRGRSSSAAAEAAAAVARLRHQEPKNASLVIKKTRVLESEKGKVRSFLHQRSGRLRRLPASKLFAVLAEKTGL